jgi:hypothetical protein
MTKVVPMSSNLLYSDHDMTYARLADLLVAFGLNGDQQAKRRSVLGLKSLLLIDRVSDESVKRIEASLEALGEEDVESIAAGLRARSAQLKTTIERRKEILKMFVADLAVS